jgi:hypothetical protein
MAEFTRKFWYFFVAVLVFTGFFLVLKSPAGWVTTLAITAGQAAVGAVIFPWMLRGLRTLKPGWRVAFLLLPLAFLALHLLLRTPPSGLMIVILWGAFIHIHLRRADVRAAFGAGLPPRS